MRAGNSIAKQALQPSIKEKVPFSKIIESEGYQELLIGHLGNGDRKSAFQSALINIVNSNEQLRECEVGSVVAAALQGETQKLSLVFGQFSVVPYRDVKSGTMKARYQLSYKGWLQLAMRSGEYRMIKARDVRKGEYKGVNPLTGEPVFNWLTDKERENLPLEGIYAFYVLHSGFTDGLYWSHEKILDHANRYSQPFKGKKELYKQMNEGKVKRPEAGSPWFDEPLSEGHLKMCKKTVIIQLFSSGIAPLSIEMQQALKRDQITESGGEFILADDPRIVEANNPKQEDIIEPSPVEVVDDPLAKDMNPPVIDAETGEIIENEQMSFVKKQRTKDKA